ncbi:unnamed protein product [Leptosia nina]|uniref:Uncharacterized protein n=1 Tax=Leptosia nina TaxID=320188 RepID=A0AAV1JKG2_9NEOP
MIPEVITSDEFENYDNILRKSWLKRFLTNKVDSRRSVKIRWNNNMYSTSSSTVFELLDCVYKNTGIVMGSRSEISTCDSSNYYANNRQVKFMPNNIEAWMIPQTIINSPYKSVQNKNMEKNRNIEVTYLDRKWYIDKSHRGNKIELVLQSKNIIQAKKSKSSDYILIDIPKGYFTDSVESNQHQTSEEEVYKITDYESPNSKIFVNKKITDFHMGDHISKEEKEITVAIRNHELVESNTLHNLAKKLPLLRDVVIQGSQVYIPKHCDVIGVGIITQRDIRDIKKPILKIQDDLTDSESAHEVSPLKKCEFAESYLQDYYKNWTPLGIDFFSWCVSDTQLRSSENNSRTSLNNQGDGSKSCPNMFDDYQGSSVVSSCNTSSCSRCVSSEQEKKKETKKDTLFSKFFCKNADVINTEARSALSEGKRFLPKDSLEVFKRRRVYANGYNSKWNALCPKSSPAPSIHIGDKCKPQPECPRDCNKPKKHVLIPDCQPYEVLQDPCDKCFPGILSFKDSTCKKVKQKHISVMPDPVCAIPPKPLCSNLCAKECSPPCSKGKKQGRPCSGKTPPICSKCSPLQPCEIAKLLKNCSDCPSLPQKCPTCGTSILPEKCPNCRVPILPQKCPKCCTPVSPLKCAKCCLPIVPQNCPNCPSQALLQKCQKCCLPMLPQKCPKCSSIVLPQKCPKCGVPLLPQRCPQCSTPIVPQKCPKCSIPILPQKCSNCSSPTSHGTCPKCSTPVGPQKCSNCCSPILPEKCRKCGSLVLPPKCRECSLTTLPQTCPRCSTIILSQKCLHCSSASLPDKCPNCCIPILPQKCPQCFTVILPTKCQKCATIVMPVTCPKCRSTIPPQKCPKCSIQVFPQICPNCRESVPQKCQKSCSPIQQQKCPKCSTPALPQKCPKCCQLILPTKCAQCDMPILPTNCSKCNASIPPQKCPKCSTVIIPQNCPRCQSPAPRQKCPKSCSPICPQKCPCSFTLLTKKCPSKPACLSPKQSNNSIRSNRYCPPKTSSPQRCASPPKNNQSCGLKIQKTATKCNKTSNPPTPPPTIACPPTRSDSQQCLKNRNDSIIRINSRENIRINLKKETPSTEEIREGYNIKVQDEDGQTLYERIDYRKPQNNKQSFHMQNKICGDSYIHRVSTPSMVLNKVALNENTIDARKSATSLENLIEINLTLKLKQCDKTEVNFCNPVDIKKEKDYVEAGAYQTKDIFQVQDQAKEPTNTEKNDVNIKILIKNFIPNDEYKSKRENNNINEQFSNSISEKFHTVSTGYSEFLLNQPAFPVETSALGVTKSAESIEKTKASKQKLEENALIPIDSTTSAFIVADQTVVENTVNFMKNDVDLTIKSDCSDRKSKESFKNIHESNTEKSETAIFMTDEEKCFENPDQEKNEKCKLLNRRQKKKMLKKLFEEASTVDGTNKEKVKGVKEMLRTILTSDSSGTEDISEQYYS